MRKFLRIIGKIILGIIALGLIAYLGFRGNEYFTGNKYVHYLKQNHLTAVPIADTVSFKFDKDFIENQLFLVGEIHEFQTSPIIDRATFRYLNQNADVRDFIVEMDPVQAYYLNQYLKDSTDMELKEILKKWVVQIGSISTEYRNEKWGKYREYYQSLPPEKRFDLYGIDVMADTFLLRKFLSKKLPEAYASQIPDKDTEIVSWTASMLPQVLEENTFSQSDSLLLANLTYDCSIPADSTIYRDLFMYRNFNRLYHQNQWKDKKIYGAFGIGHTLQCFPGTFAEMIKRKNLFDEKFVSLVPLYTNSHIAIPSNWLPGFMQDKGIYTRLAYGFDNLWFYYIRGIEDFKRASDKNSINLFKLDGKDSPYLNSNRGLKSFSVLPFIPKIPIDAHQSTTDYAQYIIYVNGSDWVKPDY